MTLAMCPEDVDDFSLGGLPSRVPVFYLFWASTTPGKRWR